jgi:hypothetical protein
MSTEATISFGNGLSSSDDSFDDFLLAHESQLTSAGVPEHYWLRLHEKLIDKVL